MCQREDNVIHQRSLHLRERETFDYIFNVLPTHINEVSNLCASAKTASYINTSVLEAVGFDAASTASASALALPIAVISLVAIPPTKFEAPDRFQNTGTRCNYKLGQTTL